MPDERHWHLDKRVPIALILTLVAQAAGFGWFAATLSARVDSNAAAIVRLSDESKQAQADNQALAVQLGRIEENTRGLRSDMNRLLNFLERGQ